MTLNPEVPLVHLNGTAKCDLIQPLREALVVLNEAVDALAKTAPNGRDYYPMGACVFRLAQQQHTERIERVKNIIAEVQLIWKGVDQQGGK